MRRGAIVQLTLLALLIGGRGRRVVALVPALAAADRLRAGRPDRLRLLVRDAICVVIFAIVDRGRSSTRSEVPRRARRRPRRPARSTGTPGSRSPGRRSRSCSSRRWRSFSAIVLAQNDAVGANPLQRQRHRAAVRLDVQVPAAEGPHDERPPAAGRPRRRASRSRRSTSSTRSGFRSSGRSRTPCPGIDDEADGHAEQDRHLPDHLHRALRPRPRGDALDGDRDVAGGLRQVGCRPAARRRRRRRRGAGKAVFVNNGCGACHTLKPAGATGKIGPDLDKLADDAQTAGKPLEEFVRESIVDPERLHREGLSAERHAARPSSRCRRTSSTRSCNISSTSRRGRSDARRRRTATSTPSTRRAAAADGPAALDRAGLARARVDERRSSAAIGVGLVCLLRCVRRLGSDLGVARHHRRRVPDGAADRLPRRHRRVRLLGLLRARRADAPRGPLRSRRARAGRTTSASTPTTR